MNPVSAPTILVVDDDDNDRYFVQWAFKKAKSPAQLQFAIDGEDAIAYISGIGKYQDRGRFPLPALILLDLKMPKVTGFELLQWLKARDGLRRLPVTVLSSSPLHGDMRRAFELGANAFVVKPIPVDQIEKVSNRAMEFFCATPAPDLQAP